MRKIGKESQIQGKIPGLKKYSDLRFSEMRESNSGSKKNISPTI